MGNENLNVQFNGETLSYNEAQDKWFCGDIEAPSLKALKYKLTKSKESIARHLPLTMVLIDHHGAKVGQITSVNEAHGSCYFVDDEDNNREKVRYYSGDCFYYPDDDLLGLVDEYTTNLLAIKNLHADNAELVKQMKDKRKGYTIKELIAEYTVPVEDKDKAKGKGK